MLIIHKFVFAFTVQTTISFRISRTQSHKSFRLASSCNLNTQDKSALNRDFRQSSDPINMVTRSVDCCDAIQWLEEFEGALPGPVFTSLPDLSELKAYSGRLDFVKLKGYKQWFQRTVELIFSKLEMDSYAIFLQSDVRVTNIEGQVIHWIDKSHLCSSAADSYESKEGIPVTLLWHKQALITPLDQRSQGRPTYSHLVCYQKGKGLGIPGTGYSNAAFGTPDVFSRGNLTWSRGIGFDCALLAVSFLKCTSTPTLDSRNSETLPLPPLQQLQQQQPDSELSGSSLTDLQSNINTPSNIYPITIVDPFCGQGTVLAIANALGMSALGVEISPKRCRKALGLDLTTAVTKIPASRRRLLGCRDEYLYLEKPLLIKDDNDNDVDLHEEDNNDENNNNTNSDGELCSNNNSELKSSVEVYGDVSIREGNKDGSNLDAKGATL